MANLLEHETGAGPLERGWAVLRDAASGWISHKAGQLGASLAYYSIFSIGPLLLVTLSVAALSYDQAAARGAISAQLETWLGTHAASTVESMLAGAGKPSEGIFATLLGVVNLIFGAIGVVVQLKEALNTVFEVKKKRSQGLWGFVRTYAVSFAGVVSLGFLLLISMVLSAILSAAGSLVQAFMPEIGMQLLATLVSFFVTTALFATMFKWLPDAEISWANVAPGAILTAALFEVGRFLVGFYIGKQGLESTFGGAASLVVLLIWVYYTSQIVLFGAEFVRAYSRSSSRRTRK
jgi:membrane protein